MTKSLVIYVVVGLGVVAVDYAVFLVLTALSVVPLVANAAAKVTSATVGFFGHSYLSFAGNKALSPVQQVFRYLVLLLLNMALTSLVIAVALGLDWAKLHAKLLADAVAFVVAYLFSRYFVYRRTPNVHSDVGRQRDSP